MAPPAASSPPSYSTKPASGEVRLDHTPRFRLPIRSFSTPSLTSSSSPASLWPQYSSYSPSSSPLTYPHSSPPQPHSYEDPSAFQPTREAASPLSSATESSTSHSRQQRASRTGSIRRSRTSRRGERVGVDDVFFEGEEGGSVEGVDLGRRSTTFALPSYRPSEEQEPPSRERRGRRMKRAVRRVKEALCVDCGQFGDGGCPDRGLVGAAVGGAAVAVGVAAWALCG